MLIQPTIYSVSALNHYIKSIFDDDKNLKYVYVRGEISSFKRQASSGHIYMILKDNKSQIKAVMFAFKAAKLNFEPVEGDQVIVIGKVSTYEERGEYQLYIEEMEQDGKGRLLIELEKLKKKLFAEGLFDESRKKAIPSYPSSIGLITGKGSAASADMIKNITRRFPLVQIYLFPTLVQGTSAPKNIIKALSLAEKYHLDTLIIGRGGGSNEDLSAFNDEGVVRAIASCTIPIISAIGHEIDTTLADLAADMRVSTPTGACEAAVPNIEQLYLSLDNKRAIITTILKEKYLQLKDKLTFLTQRPIFKDPSIIYKDQLRDLQVYKDKLAYLLTNSLKDNLQASKSLKTTLNSHMERLLQNYHLKVTLFKQRLELLNPYNVLERGYGIISDENGHVIESVDEVSINQSIFTTLKDGIIISRVTKKEKNDGK